MMRYIIGNWKCHKNSEDARRWFTRFAERYTPRVGVEIIIAPSFICLESVAAHLKSLKLDNVSLAAQDVSPFPRGGYTGAVAVDMLRGLVKYVIVGHSERRRYFHETTQDIVNKVAEISDTALTPIVCVDHSFANSQLSPLHDIDLSQIIVAYSPVDALNFKIPESPEKVEGLVGNLRKMHGSWPVVYGGALLPSNVKEYFSLPSLAGVFVGASSLDPEEFVQICEKM